MLEMIIRVMPSSEAFVMIREGKKNEEGVSFKLSYLFIIEGSISLKRQTQSFPSPTFSPSFNINHHKNY